MVHKFIWGNYGWKPPKLEEGNKSPSTRSIIEVTQSCLTLCDPHGPVALQAPPYMGFSRQEYWSGLPFPSPEDLPNPEIEPRFPTLQADALLSEPPWKPSYNIHSKIPGLVRRFLLRRSKSSSKIHCYTKTKQCRKEHLSFPPWEPQTPFSFSRAPDPFLLLRNPGLLINLPRNWLSHH